MGAISNQGERRGRDPRQIESVANTSTIATARAEDDPKPDQEALRSRLKAKDSAGCRAGTAAQFDCRCRDAAEAYCGSEAVIGALLAIGEQRGVAVPVPEFQWGQPSIGSARGGSREVALAHIGIVEQYDHPPQQLA